MQRRFRKFIGGNKFTDTQSAKESKYKRSLKKQVEEQICGKEKNNFSKILKVIGRRESLAGKSFLYPFKDCFTTK